MAAPTMRISRDSDAADEGALHLTVMGPNAFETHPLPRSGSITIGRDETADVRITDPDASRKHACLHIGDAVELEDLGSANGTRVREKKIAAHQRVTILPGEAIGIGWTTLMIQRRRQPFRPRRIWPHGYFEGRLEEECERAADTAATFAVLRLQITGGPSDAAGDLLARVLRSGDVLAVYGPNDYEVLLVDTEEKQAESLRRQIADALAGEGITCRSAAVFYPSSGRSAQTLIEQAAKALRGPDGAAERSTRVVESEPVRRIYLLAERAAAGFINILILGETGVGKEVLAKAVHEMSPRAKGPFVCINCAALTESLLESELFGHEKGAFTGAIAAKTGLLEAAAGGTVFLDEVGEMPMTLQSKLLRAIESKQVTMVGSVTPRPIDVRFVAATNRDLERAIEEKTFRADLYFRLNGISLTLPPLRARPSEIEPLARRFLADAAKAAGRRPPTLAPEALQYLKNYLWPGNIRELRNMMERAVLLSDGARIGPEDLPIEKMRIAQPADGGPTAGAAAPTPVPGQAAPAAAAADASPTPGQDPGITGFSGHADWMAAMERQRIVEALNQCAGNQTRAAQLLGISRRTLCARIKTYHIPRPKS